ncbi:homeotic protein ultrabithorax [Condylostylus longicornis]|uniref:homeotic protein ultrabithorax n=1 Tax=Condylostylus longicornis TaxID=2530218 RepID=UPI00244DBDF1|nr:homeotic protein ultrabithorax [Condylostylus longicornis]
MNSYFEQTGFYGHPHQSTGMGMGAGSHHDQTASAAAAAYRGFPLSLGMAPYANHHLQRSTQDSPYDASITAACSKIYDGAYKQDCAKNTADTNGYKDVWNTGGSNGSSTAGGGGGGGGNSGAGGQGNTSVGGGPVRPSACTPDSRVGGYLDTSGGSPGSHRGGSAASAVAGSAWNTNCTISGATAAQTAATGLHQASNHTFYPWMAIAGKRYSESLAGSLLPDWLGKFQIATLFI